MYPDCSIEIVKLQLTQAQKDFLDKYSICISDAYMGMLRAYYKNKVIWQTSCWDVYFSLKPGMTGEEFEKWDEENQRGLKEQFHDWLNGLMKLDNERLEKIFQNNFNLLEG